MRRTVQYYVRGAVKKSSVESATRRILFFPTCLVGHFFPEVGIAAVEVLERFGYRVEVPAGLTCCGQPAFNSGFHDEARRMALHTIDRLAATAGPIVIPSGSCTHMVLRMAPHLFRDDGPGRERAAEVAGRCFELSQFLASEARERPALSHPALKVAWHPSCHQARGLGVRDEPLALLDRIEGIERVPFERDDDCCGSGGPSSRSRW
jgi:L-lactate dehydrogenase complex protein LldE